MSKAGSSLLRTTLIRAADNARRQDPQLARIYYTQMVERGAEHLKALCVVAGALAERAWAVMNRQMPYVICDIDGTPVTPEQAKRIIARDFTVPDEVRRPAPQLQDTRPETGSATNHQQQWGKAPQQAAHGGMTNHTNT
jgi:hypothetical protein